MKRQQLIDQLRAYSKAQERKTALRLAIKIMGRSLQGVKFKERTYEHYK